METSTKVVLGLAAGVLGISGIYLATREKQPLEPVKTIQIVLTTPTSTIPTSNVPTGVAVALKNQIALPATKQEDGNDKYNEYNKIISSMNFNTDDTMLLLQEFKNRSIEYMPTFGDLTELKTAAQAANQIVFRSVLERIWPGATAKLSKSNVSGLPRSLNSNFIVPGVAFAGVNTIEDRFAKRKHLAQTCANAGLNASLVCAMAESKNLDWSFLRQIRTAVDAKNYSLAKQLMESRGLPY